MTKIITPMNRLKAHFASFSENISHLSLETFELQQREESYSYYSCDYTNHNGIKKAVDSDFLRVFTIDKNKSFAFKFTFLSEDKQSVVEPQYMELVFKEKTKNENDDGFSSSVVYNMNDAKDILRSINGLLKVKGRHNFDKEFLFNILKDICVPSDTKQRLDEKSFLDTFDYETAELQSALFAETEYHENLDKDITKSERALVVYKANLDETKRIKLLQNELSLLQRTVTTKTSEKRKALEIDLNKTRLTAATSKKIDLFQKIKNQGRKINESTKLSLKRVDQIINDIWNKAHD